MTTTLSSDQLTALHRGPVATVCCGHYAGVSVAVKVFPTKLDRRTVAAFDREQALLRALPAELPILRVDALDQLADGRHALRMPLCQESLTALLHRVGTLPSAEVLALGHAVARALAAAHRAGLVHGGLTPNNVLFGASGEPVVADFGMALRDAFPRGPMRLIEFLPPEAVRTDTVDAYTDLYGLGAIMHLALTGTPPHPGRLGEAPGERLLRILGEPVPAIHREDVSVELSTVVSRLLNVDRDHRPHDMSAIAGQLAALLDRAAPAPRPAPLATPTPRPAEPKPDASADAPEDAGVPVGAVRISMRQRSRWTQRIRHDLVIGAVALAALLAVGLVLLMPSDPPEVTTSPPLPPVATGASGAVATDAGQLTLANPTDLGNQVVLTWTSTETLDYAVIVAEQGKANQTLLAYRQHSMTVPVDPQRQYCFLVQGSNGSQVLQSAPKPLRGALCHL